MASESELVEKNSVVCKDTATWITAVTRVESRCHNEPAMNELRDRYRYTEFRIYLPSITRDSIMDVDLQLQNQERKHLDF